METRIHMVGIGGIGMSALAQLYVHRGYSVHGSDRGESPTTALLQRAGIEVLLGHDASHVAPGTTLLVYSDAVPEDNPERVRAREQGIRECSYFEALGEASASGTSIIVSGTHGKTTTTAMLARILIETGKEPTVIAGSILSEYGSNFVAGRDDLYVIEGCEYRRHFLKLHPTILLITNIELDHTDYYKDLQDMRRAFAEVAALVPANGAVVTDTRDEYNASLAAHTSARFVGYQYTPIPPLLTPGDFNKANARAAKAAAYAFDPNLSEYTVDAALASCTGTWRRFEYKGKTASGTPVYDDYAHHPTALRSTLQMARAEFPGKRIVAVFHPHLFSRTRDFMSEFAHALAQADDVVLAPIYPAREAPIPGITSEELAAKVTALGTPARAYASLEDVTYALMTGAATGGPSNLILTVGAGDVYRVADALVA